MDRRARKSEADPEIGATALEYGVMTFVLLIVLAVSVALLVRA